MTELVFFSAEWCEPCKWAEPIVSEVIGRSKRKITLRKVDIDTHADIARENHILSVPTLVLFKDGKEVWRMRGFDTAENLSRIVASHV